MANLNALGLGQEVVGDAATDFDSIPDQMGSFADPPQPGPFRFRLPTQMGDLWDKAEKRVEGQPGQPRIVAKFDRDHPLLILQSVGGRYDGEPFETRISNVERKRGKDATAPQASDMDYILRDSFKVEKKPKTNRDYAVALIAFAGKDFGADLEWSWQCREDKPIRVDDGQGSTVEVADKMGCGNRYYQKDVPKVPSNPDDPQSLPVFPARITCECQASLRAFANLVRFRA